MFAPFFLLVYERRWAHYRGMSGYLDHLLECPDCLTIRFRIPANVQPESEIRCDDCGQYLGTWDELQADFEQQGGTDGIFRLDKGKIKRLDKTSDRP